VECGTGGRRGISIGDGLGSLCGMGIVERYGSYRRGIVDWVGPGPGRR